MSQKEEEIILNTKYFYLENEIEMPTINMEFENLWPKNSFRSALKLSFLQKKKRSIRRFCRMQGRNGQYLEIEVKAFVFLGGLTRPHYIF